MPPLFDMLANAQNGKGMRPLARQFGLSQQQTQAAVEALLPAFSQGPEAQHLRPLRARRLHDARWRAASTPNISRTHQRAFSPQGMAEGNGILGPSVRLEGSVARRGQPGGAGDRHRPAGPAADAAGHRLDDHGRAVQAVDQPDAGQPAASAAQQSARRDHRADDAARRRRCWQRRSTGPAAAAAKRAGPVRQSVRQGAAGHVRRRRAAPDQPQARPTPNVGRQSARQDSSRTCSAAAAARRISRRRGRRPTSPPTIRSARFSRKCWVAAAVPPNRKTSPTRSRAPPARQSERTAQEPL